MSFDDPDFRAAFFEIHSGLDREAPGSDETTRRALAMAGPGPFRRVLDAGCGPGAASAVLLAALPEAHVRAVDLHAPFVEAAKARAAALGASGRFDADCADMAAEKGPFDLIWCEGAIYFLGVEAGLRGWRDALAPGGRIVFSDAVWLTDAPRPQAREMWKDYAGMTDAAGVRRAVEAAGFRALDAFVQPESDWDAYLDAVAARAGALAPKARTEGAKAAVAEALREAEVWRACRGDYGYLMVAAALA